MKDIFSISKLIIKKKIKSLTDLEKSRLKQFKKEFPITKEVDFNYVVQKITDYSTIDNNRAWESVLDKYQNSQSTRIFPIAVQSLLKYAAVFICLLGLSYYFVTNYPFGQAIPGDVITLKLENGDTKIITLDGDEKILNSDGEVIGVKKENELTYDNVLKNEKLAYNELKIPFGKRFQLVLSDGTKIHLNAGSSLKYPVHFIKGNNRMVFLTGEAYFDVTKDKLHPFIVHTNNVDVKVLGTKFNVTSYLEDKAINTVLVEGSVQVYNRNNPKQTSIVSPGEKAVWDKANSEFSINNVDVSIYTDWMKGQIIFNEVPFSEMIQKLERAYNVSISSNNKELNKEIFSANFNIDIDGIENILYYISKSHPFTFTKTDNKIIIHKPLKEKKMK